MASPDQRNQMSTHAFTTRVKLGLNSLLKPVGLEVNTTLGPRQESARLRKLQERRHWNTAKYTQGLNVDRRRCLEFLRKTCEPYQTDFQTFPRNATDNPTDYYLDNSWFGAVDAEILYCFVRAYHPAHIFEVGSGFSTRVMRRAIRDGDLSIRITSVDPGPNSAVEPYADTYIKSPIEDVEIGDIVDSLAAGDLLFIDSSHRVVTGGDIPYLFLEVMPRLKRGVYVHIHDIFLPFDYPEEWVIKGYDWTEQYLVHAFLCHNTAFEIVWPARLMWQHHSAEVQEMIPTGADIFPPSSLWLKKVE